MTSQTAYNLEVCFHVLFLILFLFLVAVRGIPVCIVVAISTLLCPRIGIVIWAGNFDPFLRKGGFEEWS